ncbi:type IV pilus assembly protein PilY1 [Xanthomonas arboricola]|uniref:PilC/PilY family type IV pilus protein n=1 Tax=Xanthomonas euroxanthea TaxID=2259622 RepID=UPI00141B69E6|nr:PilC/PilY family type IV pilus protein [Xanthomonas euroxanthea]NIK10159.1 type IV pilus assembly protein PilY1 [Xanthomonas euroxanthea]
MLATQSGRQSVSVWRRLFARATPVACAYFATLLAIPVNAGITLPTSPLTTAARVPPNLLFVLDDSGSMEWRYMYNPDIASMGGGGVTSSPTGDNTTRDNSILTTDTRAGAIYDQNYITNTIYYNPTTDYKPWVDSAGAPLSGGTTMESAYSSAFFVQNTEAGTASSIVDLSASTQTFYMPKSGATDLSDVRQYYRYQILTNDKVVRSERLEGIVTTSSTSGVLVSGLRANLASSNYYTVNVPTNASNLVISVRSTASCGRNLRCADLYVRRNAQARTSLYDCGEANEGNFETCTFATPQAGAYSVLIYGGSNYSGVSVEYSYDIATDNNGEQSAGCDTTTSGWGWRNCTYATPTGRDEAVERSNFATWYSYYRTRTKTAKGGAAAAFNGLGSDVRVGFRTIWGRNGDATTGNWPTQSVPIPVAYNQGLFDNPSGVSGANNNRARWFNRLFSATASNGTPLRSALNNAGLYYSSDSASGPYGPETGSNQLQCRQNFTILTTDGYWNGDDNFSSGGNQDGTDGAAIARPDLNVPTYTYKAVAPYSDDSSNTLADVAMRYWKQDLRTDMSNIVPTTAADPGFWQHMVTFGISIGLKGRLNPNTDLPALSDGTRSWSTPTANTVTTIDDLWHASVNGRGRFVAASDPDEFTRGLRAALDAVVQRTGSFSNVSANSTSVNADTRLYQATYVSGVWSGELASYAITSNRIATAASWTASQNIPINNRKIFTSDGVAGLSFPASATTQQIADLTRTGVSNYPVTGMDNAAYLAGNRSLELQNQGTLRNRVHLLGDVVSSSPVYVKDTDTLYVGANDGMLHAFNAANGVELFGFIPNSINWSELGSLSRPDYGHRFFVDGPIIVSDRTQTSNKNLLIGALGKGGKGIFSLDVTNPATFGVSNFKWEVGRNDADMGLVQGKPFIAKLNNGSTAVVVSNGVNSTNGRAVLFLYDINTGALIKKIDTNVGSAVADSADSNGLSEPVGWDSDGSGTVDYVYAGDLLGNVWKFDLSAATTTSWSVSGSAPIFSATYTGVNPAVRQPITGGITIAMHPTTFKTWIFFGTGRLMTTGDMTSRAVQSIYGFVEDGTAKRRSGDGANLTSRALLLIDGTRRSFEPNAVLPSTSKGWYVDLLTPPNQLAEGERVVSGAQLRRDVLTFSSAIPTASACTPDGTGYLNSLDAFTGTSTKVSYFDVNGNGMFDDDTLTASDGSKIPVGSVNLGVGMTTQASLLQGLAAVGGSSGGSAAVNVQEVRNVGRVSWREVKRGD